MSDCDVAVIGGGPAGSTAAALLAREGRRVVLLDRDRWPRYHIGESLLPGVLPFLEELGAREAVEALGFRKKTGQTFQWGKDRTPWELDFRLLDLYPYAFFVERADFDHALLKNAVRLGVELREETRVEGLLMDGGRVLGVRARGADGVVRPLTARYVIDASGQNALVARHFDTRRWVEGLRNLAVWSYWRGVAPVPPPRDEHIFTVSVPDGWVWLIPLRDGLTSVGVVTVDWTRSRPLQGADGAFDLAGWYEGVARGAETIGELLAGAARVDEVRAQRDWSYCSTRLHGPGYCLAGDAACFIDPILSTGVQLAMTGGYLSALGVNSALGEPAREAAFFRYYERSYLKAYREQLTQVRYFYRTEAHRDSVFWKSKRLLRVDPRFDGALAFVFLNSGLARHVTAESPHDLSAQARSAFRSRQGGGAPAVPYASGAGERRLLDPGGLVVVEGADRRLYGVVQRGMRLHLEPARDPLWRDRPPGSAILLEVANSPDGDPVGTVLVERGRAGLACVTRAYRGAEAHRETLERAARDVLAMTADVQDLEVFQDRLRRALAEAPPAGWALARLPPIDRVALVEHPVAAEFQRDDGVSLWVLARPRQHVEVNESPFVRTRFVDLEYRTGHGDAPDPDGFALVEWAVGAAREALRHAATLSGAIDACQEAFLTAGGAPAGWTLATVRRVTPNAWADDPDEANEDAPPDPAPAVRSPAPMAATTHDETGARLALDEHEIARALRRMAGEIAERNRGAAGVALVGVRRGGVPLAHRLQTLLREVEGREVPVGAVDITLYRDDAATALPAPHIGRSDIDFTVEEHVIVLVDDVLYTGRTTRAAIDAIMDYGRPRAIQLAALIDRGHRELPIHADYVGKVVETARDERVDVLLDQGDGAPDRAVVRLPR